MKPDSTILTFTLDKHHTVEIHRTQSNKNQSVYLVTHGTADPKHIDITASEVGQVLVRELMKENL